MNTVLMAETTTIGVRWHAMHFRQTVGAPISSCEKKITAVTNHTDHILAGTRVGPLRIVIPGDTTPKIHRKRFPCGCCYTRMFCSQTVPATSFLFALTRICMHGSSCRHRQNKNKRRVFFNYLLTHEDTSFESVCRP